LDVAPWRVHHRIQEFSGQASQKEDSKRVKRRGGKVDGTTMTWTHSV